MTGTRRLLSLFALALVLAATLAGCGAFSKDMVEDTVSIDSPKELVIDVSEQDVNVRVGDEDSIHYRVPAGREPKITQEDGVLTIEGAQDETDLSMGVKEKTYIDITLTRRELETAHVETLGGDILFDGVDVSGDLQTISGDIAIRDSQSERDISLAGTSGDIRIESCSLGAIARKATSGETRITDTTATGVDLEVTSGDTLVSCNNCCDVKVQCTSGDVTLELAGAHNSYNYDLSVGTGSIVVDGESQGEDYAVTQRGDYSVSCHATSGDISVKFKG